MRRGEIQCRGLGMAVNVFDESGNAVVEVSVDTVTETESIRERRFDPNSRVAISTETEERADSSQNQTGEVTVASNLPDGDAAGRRAASPL